MTSTPKLRGMRPLLLVPVALVLAAGCGSGAGSSSSYKTPEQILAKIPGCTSVQPDTSAQLMDREGASCDFGGTSDDPGSLYAYTFNNSGQRDQWLKFANTVGGGGIYVTGSTWLVETNSSQDASTVQKAVGGTVH